MHEQYGLKKSPALRICKALAFLLFLIFIISFVLMFVDENLLDAFKSGGKLSEERKEELLADNSFKLALRLGYEIKTSPETYGEIGTLKSVTHIVCQTRNSYGYTSSKTVFRVEKKNGSVLYFEYSRGFELSTAEIYSSHSRPGPNRFILVEKTFSGAEAKYISELLSGDEPSNLIYEIKKEEVTSKKYWDILLKFTHNLPEIRNNSQRILTICIGSPYDEANATQRAVLRITFNDDSQKFYMLIDGGLSGESIVEIDSSTYATFGQNEFYYDDYDFEVLFKETGVWQ